MIQVFVLRLLMDTETPQVLRGSLQRVTEAETMPFADEQALLALLHRAVQVNPGQEPQTEEKNGE
jgi:hypothetical protein